MNKAKKTQQWTNKNVITQTKELHSKLQKRRKEQLKKCNKDFAGGLVIGYEKKQKLESIYHLSDDVHSLIIGATRSGKSRRIVLQSISYMALAGESMIINDPKGGATRSQLKRLGVKLNLCKLKGIA